MALTAKTSCLSSGTSIHLGSMSLVGQTHLVTVLSVQWKTECLFTACITLAELAGTNCVNQSQLGTKS